MKKVLFAIQVLVILAMFPAYMILEVNHGLPQNRRSNVMNEKVEAAIIQVSLNAEVENENYQSDKMIMGSTAPVAR